MSQLFTQLSSVKEILYGTKVGVLVCLWRFPLTSLLRAKITGVYEHTYLYNRDAENSWGPGVHSHLSTGARPCIFNHP